MMMELNELFKDCSQRQKKGLHFIMASVVVWGLILGVHLTGITIEQKNLFTFCCSAVLFPLAWMISKMLHIDFDLMPFSWLYQSKSYLVMSIVIPILSLIIGLVYPPFVLAVLMVVVEIVFSICLYIESKRSQY